MAALPANIPLKINLHVLTSPNGKRTPQSVVLTSDLLYSPKYQQALDALTLAKYPQIPTNVKLNLASFNILTYPDVVRFFFNGDYAGSKMKNVASPPPPGELFVIGHNILVMLQLLFPTSVTLFNMPMKSSMEYLAAVTTAPVADPIASNLQTPHPSVFRVSTQPTGSYLKHGGQIYTLTNVVWQNDVLNSPTYAQLFEHYSTHVLARRNAAAELRKLGADEYKDLIDHLLNVDVDSRDATSLRDLINKHKELNEQNGPFPGGVIPINSLMPLYQNLQLQLPLSSNPFLQDILNNRPDESLPYSQKLTDWFRRVVPYTAVGNGLKLPTAEGRDKGEDKQFYCEVVYPRTASSGSAEPNYEIHVQVDWIQGEMTTADQMKKSASAGAPQNKFTYQQIRCKYRDEHLEKERRRLGLWKSRRTEVARRPWMVGDYRVFLDGVALAKQSAPGAAAVPGNAAAASRSQSSQPPAPNAAAAAPAPGAGIAPAARAPAPSQASADDIADLLLKLGQNKTLLTKYKNLHKNIPPQLLTSFPNQLGQLFKILLQDGSPPDMTEWSKPLYSLLKDQAVKYAGRQLNDALHRKLIKYKNDVIAQREITENDIAEAVRQKKEHLANPLRRVKLFMEVFELIVRAAIELEEALPRAAKIGGTRRRRRLPSSRQLTVKHWWS